MNKEDKIIAFLMGDMSADEKSAFEQEMQDSKETIPELSEYTELLTAMDNHQSEIPSENLKNNFEKLLSQEIENIGKNKKGKLILFTPSFLKIAGIAASIFLAGIFIGYQIQNSQKQFTDHEIKMDAELKNEFTRLVKEERTSRRIQGVRLLEETRQLDEEILRTIQNIVLTDPSSNVRLAAVEALAEHMDQDEISNFFLLALKDVEIPIIRIAIIEHLALAGEKSAIPVFKNILDQEALEKAVKDELHIGIRKLSSNI